MIATDGEIECDENPIWVHPHIPIFPCHAVDVFPLVT